MEQGCDFSPSSLAYAVTHSCKPSPSIRREGFLDLFFFFFSKGRQRNVELIQDLGNKKGGGKRKIKETFTLLRKWGKKKKKKPFEKVLQAHYCSIFICQSLDVTDLDVKQISTLQMISL